MPLVDTLLCALASLRPCVEKKAMRKAGAARSTWALSSGSEDAADLERRSVKRFNAKTQGCKGAKVKMLGNAAKGK